MKSIALDDKDTAILQANNGTGLVSILSHPQFIPSILSVITSFHDNGSGVFTSHFEAESEDMLNMIGPLLTAFFALKVVNPYKEHQGARQEQLHHSTSSYDLNGNRDNYFTFDTTTQSFLFNTSSSLTLQTLFTRLQTACKEGKTEFDTRLDRSILTTDFIHHIEKALQQPNGKYSSQQRRRDHQKDLIKDRQRYDFFKPQQHQRTPSEQSLLDRFNNISQDAVEQHSSPSLI